MVRDAKPQSSSLKSTRSATESHLHYFHGRKLQQGHHQLTDEWTNAVQETPLKVRSEIKPLTGKPYFLTIMSKYQVQHPYQLVLPASIQRALPRTTVPIALACRGNTWKVKYSGSCLVRRFESGWKRFVEDNNVRAGDGCVFEIMNDQELKFEVQILDGQLPFHPAGRGTSIDSAIDVD